MAKFLVKYITEDNIWGEEEITANGFIAARMLLERRYGKLRSFTSRQIG